MPYCTQCGTWFESGAAPTEVRCRICRESPAASSVSTPSSALDHRSPDDFDPYYNWLGIPPSRQPPHHYHLLGIADFEANTEVISNAYEQRVRHVRTFQLGERSALSQKLLSELAAARLCLMNPQQKAVYDQSILGARSSAAPVPFPAIAAGFASVPPTPSTAPPRVDGPSTAPLANSIPNATCVPPMESVTIPHAAATRALRHPRRHRPTPRNPQVEVAKIVLGGITGLAIGWFIISVYLPKLQERQSQVTSPHTAVPPRQPMEPPSPRPKPRPPTPRPGEASGPKPQSLRPTPEPDAPEIPAPPLDAPPPEMAPAPFPTHLGLADLPVFVSLPAVDAGETTPLGVTGIPDDVEITLSNDFRNRSRISSVCAGCLARSGSV